MSSVVFPREVRSIERRLTGELEDTLSGTTKQVMEVVADLPHLNVTFTYKTVMEDRRLKDISADDVEDALVEIDKCGYLTSQPYSNGRKRWREYQVVEEDLWDYEVVADGRSELPDDLFDKFFSKKWNCEQVERFDVTKEDTIEFAERYLATFSADVVPDEILGAINFALMKGLTKENLRVIFGKSLDEYPRLTDDRPLDYWWDQVFSNEAHQSAVEILRQERVMDQLTWNKQHRNKLSYIEWLAWLLDYEGALPEPHLSYEWLGVDREAIFQKCRRAEQ